MNSVPAGSVAVLPLYEILEPYFLAAFGILFSALMTWGLAILQRRTGITVQADARAQIQQAATNAAGRILAQAEGPVANISFPVGSPSIAAEIPKVAEKTAEAIKTLGYTPEVVQQKVGDLIQGKLGNFAGFLHSSRPGDRSCSSQDGSALMTHADEIKSLRHQIADLTARIKALEGKKPVRILAVERELPPRESRPGGY